MPTEMSVTTSIEMSSGNKHINDKTNINANTRVRQHASKIINRNANKNGNGNANQTANANVNRNVSRRAEGPIIFARCILQGWGLFEVLVIFQVRTIENS